ncbi:membrane protein [Ophiocordyceps sinensis CO18]|nr:membrane protein [Ophiocordyceps sinensis CO18]
MAPHVYAAALSRGAHDNASPRGFRDNVAKSESLSKAMKERIYRAEGASQNGFETLGFYAAAVVAANMAGLGTAELNALTLGYLASRLAFVVVYVHFQTNRKWAGVRSLMWGTGTIMATSLWIRAGLAVMRSG